MLRHHLSVSGNVVDQLGYRRLSGNVDDQLPLSSFLVWDYFQQKLRARMLHALLSDGMT